MLDAAQLKLLCEPFGFRPEDTRRIGWSQNEVFEAGPADDRSILRVSHGRGRTLEQVNAELAWIDDLASRGIDVCRPRPSLDGRRCERVILSGTEYLVAHFNRAPGRAIVNADIDDSLYARLGRLTAQLHAASFDGSKLAKDKYPRPMWYASRLLTDDLDIHAPVISRSFRAAVRQLIGELRPLTDGSLGLVHADISFGNGFLDGERLWIFDFDNCETGSIVQDLATVLYDSIFCRLLNRVPDAELAMRTRQRWTAFLNGYRDIRALGPIDPQMLRKFLILREAVIYTHYCRVLDQSALSETWRAGMDQMRRNVEGSITQIEFGDCREPY